MSALELVSEHACYGGVQRFYRHASAETRGPMRFSAFLPPQAQRERRPVLYYLCGLTGTEETFPIKGHAQALAAELGLILISPDTSPREPRMPGDADHWDFGQGAGFYLDATQAPWAAHYRMYSYVTRELPEVVNAELPARPEARSIMGHSMGGHGALVCALRNASVYRSVSAFAPIAAPMHCPWGSKAFTHYLGSEQADWRVYDASELVADHRFPGEILIDEGAADPYRVEQLLLDRFESAAVRARQPLRVRRPAGYDHGYYFIQTFMADHLRHHAAALLRE